MSGLSSNTNDVDWEFYRDRPEWSDVEPLSQDDGPFPIVQIAYSDKFKDIFDYFRAVLAKREISERALKLTEDAVNVNPTNYTVWHYRRILVKELKQSLEKELEYCGPVIEDSPKNYQVWHHRRILVEWLQDPSREKKFTEEILCDDPKNYHAWQHRQWVIREFKLWEGEMDYVNELLEDDVRNNSAWNQRFFVLYHTTQLSEGVSEDEIKFTLKGIEKAPNNESPWNYLRGILQDKGLSKQTEVNKFVANLYESGCRSPHLLGFMIDSIEESLLAESNKDLLIKAMEMCASLSSEYDSIRKEYWNFVARNLQNLYGTEETSAVNV